MVPGGENRGPTDDFTCEARIDSGATAYQLSIRSIPVVGSAAVAFARDIGAELLKVLGRMPVSILLAFVASTECPPDTSARAESGVVLLGARHVAVVRKFAGAGVAGPWTPRVG